MSDSANGTKKLGVIALAALVVSAMIGGGIFSLPQNMSQGAGALAVTLAWVITGVGMYFVANTFRVLSTACPDATTGIYSYARLGFGKFAGFEMAWAYWICNITGNVGYAIMMMDAMNYFSPGWFTGGNNAWSIVGGSILIWGMNYMVLQGVRQASFVNVIGTIFKLLPIFLCTLILLVVFRWSCFSFDMGGQETIVAEHIKPLGSLMEQIQSTMSVTLWAFIGIEGAVVLSARARSQRAVGVATLLGFLFCLGIYALLSILPFGVMHQPELAKLANPSTAPLLQHVVGNWGGWMMNLGVIIAILTSWLAFTIMIIQIPWAAANDGTFPKFFTHENAKSTPDRSLWITSGLMQLAMFAVYFANNAWNTMMDVTVVMILPPYLACTLYLWKLCLTGKFPSGTGTGRNYAWICGFLGSIFVVWLIYAAGLNYMLLACVIAALGIPLYVWVRRKEGGTIGSYFTGPEKIGAGLLIAAAVMAVVALIAGWVTV